MTIAVIVGTRPEIIKMTPVIRGFGKRNTDYFILHTGQHYSYNLDRVFFEQLKLPSSRYNLEVGSASHAQQTAKILIGVEDVLRSEKCSVVLVEGDTNSVLAGALAASKLHVKVGHVEAGLRSYDRTMPEEINRILTDHCSDYLFAPTEKAKSILLGEGIPEEKISVTGNTIVDAVYQNLEVAGAGNEVLGDMGLNPGEYFLATLHRQENVDSASRLASILEGLDRVSEEFDMSVICPVHPHTTSRMKEFDLHPRKITFIDPIDYLSFLQLEGNARLLMTDSGGVQEEACILKIPCVTLRDNTERPETLDVGANTLAGADPGNIVESAKVMLGKDGSWANPFGDGRASERIIEIVMEEGHG